MVNLNPTAYSESMKFKSEKSRRTAFAVFAPATLILIYLAYIIISGDHSWSNFFIDIIWCIIYGGLLWMWFDTGYEISENYVAYHSGFINGKITIDSIRKIERKKEIFGGLKPALGSQGIIVHYNKFDDIYFSPENQELFIQELKSRNPNIILDL